MANRKYLTNELRFHLGINFLFLFFITLSSYIHIPFGTTKGFFFYLAHLLVLQFSVFGIIYVFSFFRKLFTFLFPIIFIILSALSFWVYTQDISIDSGIIQVVLESKLDIAIDLLNIPFLLYIFVSSFLIIYWVYKFRNKKLCSIKSPFFYLSILAISTFFIVENFKFGTFKRKLPYKFFYASSEYFSSNVLELKEVKKNLISNIEELDIYFVLGESVRADHLSLNGYLKKTTPFLDEKENIISFKNIYTPLTYTAVSVPQILTDQSIINDSLNDKTSVYSILKKGGFETNWIGNQSLEKSYKEIVYTNDSVVIIDKFHSVLSFNKQRDLEILKVLKSYKAQSKKSIYTLHMIGSHWYYNSRVDESFKKFKPIVESKFTGSSTNEQIINSYDNTILYLDNFLNELIDFIKSSGKISILIFLSDHGENLGEDGKFFHAQNHISSKNPAMLVWYSKDFKDKYADKVRSLKSKINDSISTDFLFHSLIDLAEIEGFNYQEKKSIFKE